MWPILILFLILCFLSLCLSYLYFANDMKKVNIPGPRPLPFVGSGYMFLGTSMQVTYLRPLSAATGLPPVLFNMDNWQKVDTVTGVSGLIAGYKGREEFVQTLSDLFGQYGDVVRVYVLSSRFVLLNKPEQVEAVVSSSTLITKGESYDYLHPWLGQGLLTAAGQRWFTHRKLLTSAFHFHILKTSLQIFLKNDEILIKKLRSKADGTPINIFPLMALLALDNVSEAAMGVSVNAQSDSQSEYVTAVNEISVILFKKMRHPVYGVEALFKLSSLKKQQDKYLSTLHGYTGNVIANRRKALEASNTTLDNYLNDIGIKKKSVFLDILLLSEVDGKKLDDTSIREEVDTFMFEGHDTTTSGISFALYCISQYKHVQEKLFSEQKDIFGDDLNRVPTNQDISNMHYLKLVIMESLRLYPSVPMIGRRTTEDIKIGEYNIPKNTNLTICILQMQRNPAVFEDPLVFQPERFETMNTSQKNAYSWLAFSAGPRNCIGQKFAMMELKVAISSIIRQFHILPGGIEPQLSADLILRSENGVHIKLLPRDIN